MKILPQISKNLLWLLTEENLIKMTQKILTENFDQKIQILILMTNKIFIEKNSKNILESFVEIFLILIDFLLKNNLHKNP